MPAVHLVVAGPIDRRTGGSIYNRRIADALVRLGWSVEITELPGPFPDAGAAGHRAAAEALAALPSGTPVLADGLAVGALADSIDKHRDRLHVVALVHMPIAFTPGLDTGTAARFAGLERRALAACGAVVITGEASRRGVEKYGVPGERLHLIEPGTDRAATAAGSNDGRLRLLCVANVHRGKGHDVLFRALATARAQLAPQVSWRLTCAGSLTHDEPFVAGLRQLAAESGLSEHVHLAGELDQAALDAAYASSDLFVLATRQETYGMAVAEAVARGLPVVSTATGAIATILGHEAGIVVPPGDERALADALALVMGDDLRRGQLRDAARRRREVLPTWETAARKMDAVLREVVGHA